VLTLAGLLTLPTLRVGLLADDLWQLQFVGDHLHGLGHDDWWEMFGARTAGSLPALTFLGFLPWWTSASFHVSFFRPFAVVTHYLDVWLWPNSPWLMHAQNVIMYGLLCWVVTQLYRHLLGSGAAAALAACLYAISAANVGGVTWIAGRNTVLTALFATLTLLVLIAPKSKYSSGRIVLAATTLALAHLSSEGAIAIWPYILGWALCSQPKVLRRTLACLALLCAVSIACSTVAMLLGYTTQGSGVYIDPRMQPLHFLRVAIDRFPQIVSLQLGTPTRVFGASFSATTRTRQVELGVALVWLLVGALALPAIWKKPGVRALAIGSLGSALILCPAPPSPRLLFMVGVGAYGVLAEALVWSWSQLHCRSRLRRVCAMFVVFWVGLVHLILAPVSGLLWPMLERSTSVELRAVARQLFTDPDSDNHTIAVLNTPSFFGAVLIGAYQAEVRSNPQPFYVLGASVQTVSLTRDTVQSLVLKPTDGYLLEPTSLLARSPDEPFVVGQAFALRDIRVIVKTLTRDGRPQSIQLQFVPDQAQHIRWVAWDRRTSRFESVAIPQLNETLRL
jgi:hypothetical protein